MLPDHVGKYSGRFLLPAQESLIPSVNKPKEYFLSSKNLVLFSSLLSNAGTQVGNSLIPVSVILSVSFLLLLVEKSLLWPIAPPFHHYDTLVVTQEAREDVTVLLASLFKF